MTDKREEVRFTPFDNRHVKELSERIANLLPGSGYDPWKNIDRTFKNLLIKESGLTEEEFDQEVAKAAESREKRDLLSKLKHQGKFTVWHNTFAGTREVLLTENIEEVLMFLRPLKRHLKTAVLDDNYVLELPDGRQLWQMSIIEWIYQQKARLE